MKNILLFLLLINFTNPAAALESGAQFLKIDTDARAVSMGAAYTALASGVESLAYNPAGLSAVKGVELGFSHTNWLMDSRHDRRSKFIIDARILNNLNAFFNFL